MYVLDHGPSLLSFVVVCCCDHQWCSLSALCVTRIQSQIIGHSTHQGLDQHHGCALKFSEHS